VFGVPSALTEPAPAWPRPLPTVVVVTPAAVVVVVVGATVVVGAAVVVEGATVVDETEPPLEPGIVVLTPEGTVVVAASVVVVLASVVVVVGACAVLVFDEPPRSPGCTMAMTVDATKTAAAASRMSFWLVFRGTYLGRRWGWWEVLAGAGDGNRTRTTSLEGWGSSR
jgi:hypothetical protein